MTIKQKLSLTLAAASGILACSAAHATVLQYTFDAGSYYDFNGGNNVVTGSFDYNTASGAFTNVTYNRGGETFNTASATGPGAMPDQAFFGDTSSSDYDVYSFAAPLANGGTDAITAAYHPNLPVSAGGSVTTTGAVPEPATWAIMLVGMGMAGAMMRRRGAAISV